jgi:hypothetical protein
MKIKLQTCVYVALSFTISWKQLQREQAPQVPQVPQAPQVPQVPQVLRYTDFRLRSEIALYQQ